MLSSTQKHKNVSFKLFFGRKVILLGALLLSLLALTMSSFNCMRSINYSGRVTTPRAYLLRQPQIECRSALLPGESLKNSASQKIRFTPELYDKYVTMLSDWEGWMAPPSFFFTGFLSQVQHRNGVVGPVGEIGVHHGKFAVAIAMFAFETERVWAADLFERQNENVDGSGKGSKEMLLKYFQDFGIDTIMNNRIVTANSMSLKGVDLRSDGFSAFRFLSVDGGHTHETTLNDLFFSCEVVQEGSIVVLDDFVNQHWLGVPSGAFHFIRSQKQLIPFLWASNKLFFTSSNFANVYLQAIDHLNASLCDADMDVINSRQIFPGRVCVVTCHTLDCNSDFYMKSYKNLLLL